MEILYEHLIKNLNNSLEILFSSCRNRVAFERNLHVSVRVHCVLLQASCVSLMGLWRSPTLFAYASCNVSSKSCAKVNTLESCR